MPLFHYKALDESGRRRSGQIEASSEAAAETALKEQGQWLTEVKERAARVETRARPRGNRPASRRVLIEFFLQVGLQLRSGIPLVDALAFGLEDCPSAAFREVQSDLVERLKAGALLSE